MLPPPLVRRVLCTPLLFALTALVVLLFPFVYTPAALKRALVRGGRDRVTRLLWFALAWGLLESRAVLACGLLWCRAPSRRSRGARYQDRHYEIIRRYVAGLHRVARRRFGLRIEIDGDRGPGAAAGDRPLIVLSRHAGPGDALLLVHHLLTDYGRRPRVVMKEVLRLDPCIDIAANRLPNAFVGGGGAVERIEALATGLGPRDALLIFPEGGNFTPDRRLRAIRRLMRLRRERDAVRAARMRHVMPPRAGGSLAAIAAAPDADVVFVAHSGLEDMDSAGDVWRSLPLTAPVHAHWWRIAAENVPRDPEARSEWFHEQWERVDTWIDARHTAADGERPGSPEA
ncbi:hypothetical protein [Spirillospora sp. NBC_01491]|uniref:hypothetical protein n=1 Tax=Spirillospora sp. NBC_01491 TaxID=2976007 RepID=UPI002E3216F2|nr:hypothetical protein [Spirillospora sp. NBC_01491]